MTRLFALLPLVASALATMGGGSDNMGASPGGGDSSGSGIGISSSKNNGQEEVDINIGPVQIKIIGSFSGLGKWNWQGAKPGENSTVHQV
jgi:hypothetical protein